MTSPSSSAEERYTDLAEALLSGSSATQDADVTAPKGTFGASSLKIDSKIFAMLSGGHLVVKLPRRRVDELVAAGEGERFSAGGGRVMKEWLSLNPDSGLEWLPLAREALEFVAPKR